MHVNPYHIGFTPATIPSLFQQIATQGYGPNLMDLIKAETRGIASQANQQLNRTIGILGRRGLYDSSITSNAISGILANRERRANSIEQNWMERNRQLMLRGQELLNRINLFNTRMKFQTDQFNKQMDFNRWRALENFRLQQAQIEAQRRAAQQSLLSNLIGGGLGLLGMALLM